MDTKETRCVHADSVSSSTKKNRPTIDDANSIGKDRGISSPMAVNISRATIAIVQMEKKQKKKKKNRSVHFGTVEIQEYLIQLGGDGVPRTGPVISLSRKLASSIIVSVLEYEALRLHHGLLPRTG